MPQRDNDVRFLRQLIKNIGILTNVAQLGRVVSFVNSDHSKINVQPMALNKEGNKRAMLLNVRVGRLLRSELVIGDVVVVLFLDRSLENWDGSSNDFILNSDRTHNVNDAFVVEVY